MPRRNPALPFLRRSDPQAQHDHPARRQPVEPVLLPAGSMVRRAPEADYWLRHDTLVEPPIHPRVEAAPQPAPAVVPKVTPPPPRRRRLPVALLLALGLLGPSLAVVAAVQPGVLLHLSGVAAALRGSVAPPVPELPVVLPPSERAPDETHDAQDAAGPSSAQSTGPAPADPPPETTPATRPAPPDETASAPDDARLQAPVPQAAAAQPVIAPAAATPPPAPTPASRDSLASGPAVGAAQPVRPPPPHRALPPARAGRGVPAGPEFVPFDPPPSRRDISAEREAATKAVPRNARCALLIRTAQLGIGLEVTDLAYLRRVCAPD